MTVPETDLETLVIRVRADTREALAGVGAIERQFDGPLAAGAARAGDGIGRALGRAVSSGKDGFEDLRRVALAALGDIAANALRSDLGGLFDGGGGASLAGLFSGVGRASGGGVSPGRPVLVGERGPELFVPASAGRVETGGGRAPINVTVNVAAPREAGGAVMQQTAAQVARAVARALEKAR
ncbi:hypothetical protein IP88_03870 [alpha proteobacterium AAP81b]|nr:hypothetical protein IP88_03870 [alpha proteobacterium AAP81b]